MDHEQVKKRIKTLKAKERALKIAIKSMTHYSRKFEGLKGMKEDLRQIKKILSDDK